MKARVGIKALLFIARDSNEYNLEPLVYATDEAVASFLPKVYMIDMHDFLTKLDGFSISGGALAGKFLVRPAMWIIHSPGMV